MRTPILLVTLLVGLASGCIDDETETAEDQAALSPSPNDQHAFNFFVGKGLSDIQAAGIIGNLDQESQMNPNAVQPNGVGHGVAQWSEPGRWDDLIVYANSIGQSPWSLDVQLAFVWRELPSYGLTRLRTATDVATATIAFENDYEMCGNCAEASRINYARAALAAYGGHSAPVEDRVAFQANTGELWTGATTSIGPAHLGMMHGTSPSIVALSGGGYEIAFQANTGELWTTGTAGTTNWHLGMQSGTNPSITALPNNGYEVAFQANTSSLWTAGTAGTHNWGLGMDAASSPSITALSSGGYEIAFQANTHNLWIASSSNFAGNDASLGMMHGTSPSITALPDNGYEVAFQANTSSLWTTGTAGSHNWNLGMDALSSPSIAAVSGGGYAIAFQANTHSLWFATSSNFSGRNASLGMHAGTSPAISHADPSHAYFQANTGNLWSSASGAFQLGMNNSTSPSGT